MDDPSGDPVYKNLVRKVLNVPALVRQKDLMLEPGVLNLVQEDWWSVLQNSPVYQAHQKKQVLFSGGMRLTDKPFTARAIIGNENHPDVLVVGLFRLEVGDSFTTLIVISCKATSVIGSAVCTSGVQDNSKFFFTKCGAMCSTCRKHKLGPQNLWCVRQTKVFDGDVVRYAQRLYVQSVFTGEFVGLVRLRIQSKIEFGNNNCKIVGTCKDIMFMKENALNAADDLGDILTWNGLNTAEEVDDAESLGDPEEEDELDEEVEASLLTLPQGYTMPTIDARKYKVTTKKQRLM